MKSKKKLAKQKAKKELLTKFRESILKKSGYTDLKNKHKKSRRPDFPDLKTDNKYQLSNSIVNGFRVKPASEHPDAKQFPVGNSHKQGLELIYSKDYASQMNGRKT